MLNSTSFTGLYLVNGPKGKDVNQTVNRIKQECKQQKVDVDTFIDPITKDHLVFTEKDAQTCRDNKDAYISHSEKVRDIVKNTPDNINEQMAQMPKMPKSLRPFLQMVQNLTIFSPVVEDRTSAINKDLDEGTFNIIEGTGPNLTKASDDAFEKQVNDILDSVKK